MWWTMGGEGVAEVRVRLRVYGWGRGHRWAVLATLVDRDLAVVAQREQRLLVGPEAVIGVPPFLEGGDGPLHWFGVPAKEGRVGGRGGNTFLFFSSRSQICRQMYPK